VNQLLRLLCQVPARSMRLPYLQIQGL
jgi:hypothetical protein